MKFVKLEMLSLQGQGTQRACFPIVHSLCLKVELLLTNRMSFLSVSSVPLW